MSSAQVVSGFADLLPATQSPLPFGNHDYWGNSKRAFGFAQERFPELATNRWYSRTYNDLGLIWHDSNARVLGKKRWKEQLAWFEETLKTFAKDIVSRGIILFA